ncbi:MAG: hypothetical protein HYY93_15455, partial [Planctomycetes bacterium]|nr:hypothetical protein [Planctomycetota bacterium]
HPTPPPAFYGVSTLASLPTATTCWSALFVGLTAGCVFGGLFGLFLLLAEVRRVSGPRLLVVGVVLEVLCSWSMLTRDNLLLATPCALALPVASFFGYRAVWRIRWGGN